MTLSQGWTGLYLGWVAGEIFIAIATRTRRRDARVQDRGTQIILWAAIVLSLSLSGWLQELLPPDMPFSHALRPVSLGILIAGLTVRVAAILTLGRSFTANVATHATQTIERRGLYRFIRHPSYLGMEIIFLAIGVHTRSWICLAVVLVLPTLAVLYRIHVEEIALRGAFGEDYVAYSRTTRRLIPGIY